MGGSSWVETFSHQQESVERVSIVSRGPHAWRPQVCFDLVPHPALCCFSSGWLGGKREEKMENMGVDIFLEDAVERLAS